MIALPDIAFEIAGLSDFGPLLPSATTGARGVLNSSVVNKAIKPYQTEGVFHAKRDIHKRPFEVCPIPLCDISNQQLWRNLVTTTFFTGAFCVAVFWIAAA
jgi:hypothetical protein